MSARKKTPRETKTARNTSIVGGVLYFEDVAQCSLDDRDKFEDCIHREKAIRLISLGTTWYQREWVGDGLYASDIDTELTLRVELRNAGVRHWYAYRRVAGVLFKRYVGQEDRLTSARLLEVCRAMPSARSNLRKA